MCEFISLTIFVSGIHSPAAGIDIWHASHLQSTISDIIVSHAKFIYDTVSR